MLSVGVIVRKFEVGVVNPARFKVGKDRAS